MSHVLSLSAALRLIARIEKRKARLPPEARADFAALVCTLTEVPKPTAEQSKRLQNIACACGA